MLFFRQKVIKLAGDGLYLMSASSKINDSPRDLCSSSNSKLLMYDTNRLVEKNEFAEVLNSLYEVYEILPPM